MSDARLDALAESARNRRLKLVRSRVRTPGKRRFGKVGLSDGSGKPVFGLDAKGPTATPDDVEAFLRKLDAKDWGASLDVAAPARKRTTNKPPPRASNDDPRKPATMQKPAARAKLPPKPEVREARPADSPRVAELSRELGHPIDAKQVRKNLAALTRAGDATLVATVGKSVVGMCGVGRRVVIHRPAPLGRITALIVADAMQGQGIGKLLVDAAEQWCRKHGCALLEVTSNDRRAAAHAFYRHMGYERTSIRFVKTL